MKILHNNRCSKSRCALAILEEKNLEFEVVKYLENPLTEVEIKDLLQKLKMPAADLIRKSEAIFKSEFKGKSLTEAEWISAMATYPKLIERPILINGDKAVVGRPPEKINEII